jgi:hypothetical protein
LGLLLNRVDRIDATSRDIGIGISLPRDTEGMHGDEESADREQLMHCLLRSYPTLRIPRGASTSPSANRGFR